MTKNRTNRDARRGELTKADEEAAKRLRWYLDKSGLKQSEIAKKYGEFGSGKAVSQGLISQYKNGKIKLGVVATVRFARILEIDPRSIRPDFEDLKLLVSDLPPRVQRIAAELAMYNDDVLDDLEESIKLLRTMGPSYQDFLRKLRDTAPPEASEPLSR